MSEQSQSHYSPLLTLETQLVRSKGCRCSAMGRLCKTGFLPRRGMIGRLKGEMRLVMPKTGNGDSPSAFSGENRPRSQMTHRLLLLTDIQSSITGPDFRADPVPQSSCHQWRCATGPWTQTGSQPFSRSWVPPIATLQGPGVKSKLIVVCGSREPATKMGTGTCLNVTTVGWMSRRRIS